MRNYHVLQQQEEDGVVTSSAEVIAATPIPFPPAYIEQSLPMVAGVQHVSSPVFNMEHLAALDFLPASAMIDPFGAAGVAFMRPANVQPAPAQAPRGSIEDQM